MSVWQDIREALDTRLSIMVGIPDVAWSNTKFEVTQGELYIRPTILFGDSTLNTLDGQQLNMGIYQVDVFVPTGNGSKDLLDLMDDIYDHFKADISLTVNSTTVFIDAVGVTPSQRDESWYWASVEINFQSCV